MGRPLASPQNESVLNINGSRCGSGYVRGTGQASGRCARLRLICVTRPLVRRNKMWGRGAPKDGVFVAKRVLLCRFSGPPPCPSLRLQIRIAMLQHL